MTLNQRGKSIPSTHPGSVDAAKRAHEIVSSNNPHIGQTLYPANFDDFGGFKLDMIPAEADLVIPIYLDTNTLLDLLASLEDGFSMIENLTTRTSDSKTSEASANVGFGIASALSFLKVDITGSARKASERLQDTQSQRERFHTYGSLLNRLRASLNELNLVKEVSGTEVWQQLNPSDFVEAQGRFEPNPLHFTVQTLKRLMSFAPLFEDQMNPLGTSGKKGQPNQAKKVPESSTAKTLKQIDALFADVEPQGVQTYVVDVPGPFNYRMVTSLFSEYIRDRSGTELPYGEFRILGKVVRKINDQSESINLIRPSSALYGVSKELLDNGLSSFGSLNQSGLNIPRLETEVRGPALQVVPISVFI